MCIRLATGSKPVDKESTSVKIEGTKRGDKKSRRRDVIEGIPKGSFTLSAFSAADCSRQLHFCRDRKTPISALTQVHCGIRRLLQQVYISLKLATTCNQTFKNILGGLHSGLLTHSCSRGREFTSQLQIYFVIPNSVSCLKRGKINEKLAGDSPF